MTPNGTAKPKYPRIAYARTVNDVARFAGRYEGRHTVCYSLNPRPRVFKNARGFPRSACESDIETAQNVLFDFGFDDLATEKGVQALEALLSRSDEYFRDQRLQPPARAFSGAGYHLLFALPELSVAHHPELRRQLTTFRNNYASNFKHELRRLGVRLDNTQDLRRVVKIYGTAKPGGAVSRFYGGHRVEDPRLAEYILSLPVMTSGRGIRLNPGSTLPPWFPSLLSLDERLSRLWEGRGKPVGTDQSRSGLDYSVVRRLLWLGYRDPSVPIMVRHFFPAKLE